MLSREEIARRIYVSEENLKLQRTGSVAWLIFNLPAIVTCPGATEHCKKFCYARKAENCYPDCLPARKRNFECSRSDCFREFMTDYIHGKIRRARKKRQWRVRIHESGDFYNQEYTDKWLGIAEDCIDTGADFWAYTKSFRFFDGKTLPPNFKLLASVWDDTPIEDIKLIIKNGWRIYTAVTDPTNMETVLKELDPISELIKRYGLTGCACVNCSACGKCGDDSAKIIACEIH